MQASMRSASSCVMMHADRPAGLPDGTRSRHLGDEPTRTILASAMSPVLFFDPGCPAPYSRLTLDEAALGGTEATVVRIAEALDAVVIQHNRMQAEGRYRPA